MADTAIFDVDGTLVDSNYQHALAWHRAFRRYDVTRPLWRIHRGIGMGGDTFVPSVAGQDVEDRWGEQLREAYAEEFGRLIEEVAPLEHAHELLAEVKRRGFKLVLASSGQQEHVETLLRLFDGERLADAWTTSADAEHSKPEPDIVQTAMSRVEGARGVMVGDSTWDVVAAGRLDIATIAVRTGGFSVEELQEAGAVAVLDSLGQLRDRLDETPLARPS